MTTSDRVAFEAAFRSVVRIHGVRSWTDADIMKLRDDYWQALEDLPLGAVQKAAEGLVKGAGRWPKPRDWREAVQRQVIASVPSSPAVVMAEDGKTETSYLCLHCEDTGWRPDCGCDFGRLEMFTGRCPFHGPKPVELGKRMPFRACECRARNSTWLQHHTSRIVETHTS